MSDAVARDDARLRELTVAPGELIPGFLPVRPSYAVTLPHDQTTLAVQAAAQHPEAVVCLAGEPLAPGAPGRELAVPVGCTSWPIDVTAADGTTTKRYELKTLRAAAGPDWERVLEHAPFAARDSAGEVVADGEMWLLGGYVPELLGDVWRSRDGRVWRQVGTIPDEAGINIPVAFAHAGRVWVSGNTGRLWASADGASWELVNEAPPWAGRYAAGSAVFAGRMWVLGGRRGGTLYADVWSSVDGVTWTCEVERAPWAARQPFGNVVAHRDRLWLVGGGITMYQPFRAYRDVWSSRDGRQWELVTEQAPWPARTWSCCAVYRDRIWLLGGFRGQPTWQNFADVWYSVDGVAWQRLETPHQWTARHELSPYVHDGALWVVAGNNWPLVNDVWRLALPGLCFLSQPVLEEFAGQPYRYEARADFHADGGPLLYRLEQGPPWLRVHPATGVVSGVPPVPGEYPVVLAAHAASGEVARQSFAVAVMALS